MKGKRVFIGLQEIAGYYSYLAKGLNELGYRCTFITLSEHRFKYEANQTNSLIRFFWRVKSYSRRWRVMGIPVLAIFDIVLKYLVILPALFVKLILTHQVFIFSFGSSFFLHLDTILLVLFGKKVIYVFNGSDARPPYMDGAFQTSINRYHKHRRILSTFYTTFIKSIKIRLISALVYNTVSQPGHSQFFRHKSISFLLLGLPFKHPDPGISKDKPTLPEVRKIKILHSPSDPIAKGTAEIRNIIGKLQVKYPIEYTEIVDIPNLKVIEKIKACDFIIDQLYSDFPMAAFVREAAHFGKPAVVGGYYAPFIDLYHGQQNLPPSLFIHPDKIESGIEKMITDSSFRESLGKRAQEFVHSQWTYLKVAERYAMIIENRIPEEWWFDPKTIDYAHGWGCPEWQTKQIVREMVSTFGVGALQLKDKPKVQAAVLNLAGIHN